MNEKKHAYLIMAHGQWNMLKTLLNTIDDERNDIFLHIDKKATDVPFNDLKESVKKSGLFFTKRYNIVWGGTQMMKCTLNMLSEAQSDTYSYYHLLSGADLPLKSQNYIHKFFEDNTGKEFISFNWAGINTHKFDDRLQYYHFFINVIGKRTSNNLFIRSLGLIEDFSLRIQAKLNINRLNNNVLYKGSQWFSITNTLVSILLQNKNKIIKSYKFSAICDELWLQNFVMGDSSYTDKICDNHRYIKWGKDENSPHILTLDDFDNMCNSEALFARKFDLAVDKNIVEEILSSYQ